MVRGTKFLGSVVANSYGMLSNGDVVLNAFLYDPDTVGFPFHRMNPDGRIVHSFGPGAFWSNRQNVENTERRLTVSSDGAIWAAFASRYVLEHWHLDGERDVVLERLATWFPPDRHSGEVTPTDEPVPRVRAINMDNKNRLWTLIEVADSHWAQGLREMDDGRFFPVDDTRVWDTIIDVIDPVEKSLLVSERQDPHLIGFVDDELVYSSRSRSIDARMIYDVWRIRILENN